MLPDFRQDVPCSRRVPSAAAAESPSVELSISVRQPVLLAVLIGAGARAVTGAVAACTGPKREEWADAPIIAGAFGAGLGLAVGALIHKTTIVYP